VAFNASHQTYEVQVPFTETRWTWVINTINPAPKDFYEKKENLKDTHIKMGPYSSILLMT
jgi:hypothetical protein